MKILQSSVPIDSIIEHVFPNYQYIDCFETGCFLFKEKITPSYVTNEFFSSLPVWAKIFLAFRNLIVSIFKIKQVGRIRNLGQQFFGNYEKGDRLGPLLIYESNKNELIFGLNDKHLDFRGSLFIAHFKNQKISISIITVVKFNNNFGKFYFKIIQPFHKIIMKVMLSNLVESIK